ncbi:hypothetical protein C8Q76DRAFT_696040 [Earliella scabrosa]|nr:hypothetical protein C8Q76DRAFT_696040 [Earliella scabrosa]
MSLDVAQIIKADHDNIRDLFMRFKTAGDTEKIAIGNTLLREMSVHGDAEDTSVYNTFEQEGLAKMAELDRKEHENIKQLIKQADKAHPGSDDYADFIKRAVDEFLNHADEEERDQLTKVTSKLSAEENDKVARKFLKARKGATTSHLTPKKEFVDVKKPLPEA